MSNTLLEREPQNAGRPVASGNCCIPNTSKKEDICKTLSGAEGKCVPEGAQVNCRFQSSFFSWFEGEDGIGDGMGWDGMVVRG